MKKYLTILLILVNFHVFSQIKFGFNVGASFSQIENSNVIYSNSDQEYNKVLLLGTRLNVPFFNNSDYFYFQPEINFVQKGREYRGFYDFGSGEKKYTDKLILNYLEIPISLKLNMGLSPFYLFGGIYGGYCLGGYNKLIVDEQINDSEIELSEYNISIFDSGFQSGFGIQKGFGITKFIMEFKYSKSLIDIDLSEVSAKNKYFGISIGLLTQIR